MKQRVRALSPKVIGVVATIVAFLTALSVGLSASKVLSWLGVNKWISASGMQWAIMGQGVLGLVSALLVTLVAYGLWRLATGCPGANLLFWAFALELTSWASFVAILLSMYAANPDGAAQWVTRTLLAALYLVPAGIGLFAGLLRAVGLLQSRIVAAWIAWLGAMAVLVAGASTALGVPAYWHILDSPLRFGVEIARFAWLGFIGSGLEALFWLALGVALLASRDVQEAPGSSGADRA